MTSPSFPKDQNNGIPQDVIDAANKFSDLYGDGKQGYVAFDIAVFAILAERERCAAIADAMRDKHGKAAFGTSYECGVWDQGVRIANKIRRNASDFPASPKAEG